MTENKTNWFRFPDLKELKKIWDDNILMFPYETLFKLGLLGAGAIRTFDFFTSLNQEKNVAIFGLLFAEVGIIIYEILIHRGKRISKKQKNKKMYLDFKSPFLHIFTEEKYKYSFFNQKRLANIGLWVIHVPIAVFFSGADVIVQNLSVLAGGGASLQETFTWMLGAIIAFAIFGDLAILIGYGMVNPESMHKEAVNQIDYERKMWALEKQRIEIEAEMEYEKAHATPLAQARARFNKGKAMVQEFSDTFDKDFILSKMGDDEFKDMHFKDEVATSVPVEEQEERIKRKYTKRIKNIEVETNEEEGTENFS
jgi:hypothetical protein